MPTSVLKTSGPQRKPEETLLLEVGSNHIQMTQLEGDTISTTELYGFLNNAYNKVGLDRPVKWRLLKKFRDEFPESYSIDSGGNDRELKKLEWMTTERLIEWHEMYVICNNDVTG